MTANYYNAVFRDGGNQVVARTFLTDPKNLPWSWKIEYGDKEIMDAKELDGVLCGPCKPLNITRRKLFSKLGKGTSKEEPKEEIEVKFIWNNNEISFKVKGSNSVEDVRFIIARKVGVLPPMFSFSLDGKLLRDERLTMTELGVSENKNVFKQLNNEEIFEAIPRGPAVTVDASKALEASASDSNPFEITIKALTGKTFKLQVASSSFVVDLMMMIHILEGIPGDQQRLLYSQDDTSGGREMERELRLCDYNIKEGSIVHLVLRLRGGGGLDFSDMEGKCVTGKGKPAKPQNYWKSYKIGLNLKGNCGNPNCKSRQYATKDLVVYKFGFGSLTLTESSTFQCPACNQCTFKPADFLISGANCEFRFRKSEEQVVKSRNLVSEPFPKYLKLEDGEGKVKYEFIEIFSVPLARSSHYCCVCGDRIGNLVDEVKLSDCCHYCHKECAIKQTPRCPVCYTLMVVEIEFRTLAIFAEDLEDFI